MVQKTKISQGFCISFHLFYIFIKKRKEETKESPKKGGNGNKFDTKKKGGEAGSFGFHTSNLRLHPHIRQHPPHPPPSCPPPSETSSKAYSCREHVTIHLPCAPKPNPPLPLPKSQFLDSLPFTKEKRKKKRKKKEIFISFASLSRRTIPETICVHLPYFSNMGIPRGGRNVGRRLRPYSGGGARRVRQSSLLGQKSTSGSFRGEKDPNPRRALLVPHLPLTKPNLDLFVSALLLLL